MKPPRAPPEALRAAFTMNHTVPLAEFYIDDSEGGRGTHYEYQREELDQLIERSKVSWDHFAGQPSAAWATSAPGRAMLLLAALRQLPIEGKHVGVWGTIEPWAECYCLAAGAERVTTIDYNRLTFHHPKMSTLTVAELEEADGHDAHAPFDVALSLSSFDHDGLGRYGDPLRPDGDYRAMRAAWRSLRVGGTLLLSVPVGPDVVVWNLHRRYGARRLPLLLHGWEVAARYGWDEALLDAEGNWRQTYEPLLALKRTQAGELPPPPAPPPPPPPEDDREL